MKVSSIKVAEEHACRLCGSQKAAVLRSKVRYDIPRRVLQCECGFVYLERGMSQSTYASKNYRAKYGPKLGVASSPKQVFDAQFPFQKQIIGNIKHVLSKRSKVLDVGCSSGFLLAALKGKVAARVGIELSKEEATFIKKNLDFPIYTDPADQAEIKEGPFDLITSIQVLEHTEDPVAFLRSLKRHLKPGGRLYLELPNLDDVLISQYQLKEYEDFYFREVHLSYFTKETLARALKLAGFSGKIGTVQRYNFRNHMQWLLARKPQGDFVLGNKPAWLVEDVHINKAGKALNRFIERADEEYKRLVGQLGLGESLTFLGKMSDTE